MSTQLERKNNMEHWKLKK